MKFWYPLAQEPEEIFPYSQTKHQEVSETLENLVYQIEEAIISENQFTLTENQEHCKYCIFRSFCDRGHHTSEIPGGFDLENEELSNTHFDLDLINEIEF